MALMLLVNITPPTNSVVPPTGKKLKYQQNGGKNLGTTSAVLILYENVKFF
jgi:hypothetical protein